ncbi:hypothetical protein KC357_g7 [Hortaea werneckii]|nr:hypothetical protein KC357_g7 [Hortaea werneckii]
MSGASPRGTKSIDGIPIPGSFLAFVTIEVLRIDQMHTLCRLCMGRYECGKSQTCASPDWWCKGRLILRVPKIGCLGLVRPGGLLEWDTHRISCRCLCSDGNEVLLRRISLYVFWWSRERKLEYTVVEIRKGILLPYPTSPKAIEVIGRWDLCFAYVIYEPANRVRTEMEAMDRRHQLRARGRFCTDLGHIHFKSKTGMGTIAKALNQSGIVLSTLEIQPVRSIVVPNARRSWSPPWTSGTTNSQRSIDQQRQDQDGTQSGRS